MWKNISIVLAVTATDCYCVVDSTEYHFDEINTVVINGRCCSKLNRILVDYFPPPVPTSRGVADS